MGQNIEDGKGTLEPTDMVFETPDHGVFDAKKDVPFMLKTKARQGMIDSINIADILRKFGHIKKENHPGSKTRLYACKGEISHQHILEKAGKIGTKRKGISIADCGVVTSILLRFFNDKKSIKKVMIYIEEDSSGDWYLSVTNTEAGHIKVSLLKVRNKKNIVNKKYKTYVLLYEP
jgi:hypothetical protein